MLPAVVIILLAHQSLALNIVHKLNQEEDNKLWSILGADLKHHANSASDFKNSWRLKRDPFGITARGFHDDVFSNDFGNFKPYKRNNGQFRYKRDIEPRQQPKGQIEVPGDPWKISPTSFPNNKRYISHFPRRSFWYPKRRPSSDFHGDAFTQGFGEFETMRKRIEDEQSNSRSFGDSPDDKQKRGYQNSHFNDITPLKRRPEEFHGDTFTGGFGDFSTMRKRRPSDDFYGDAFTEGFGDFSTMKKRRPSDDFHGDAFTEGFGDFSTMKKRRPSDDFHGDAFTEGFGDFSTMRKRRPSDDFHGDAFTQGFGDFSTMRKRRPNDDFHGNAFTEGFGDFSTMKKRRPSDDFHGDAFTQGFGDFSTMKRRPSDDFHGNAFTEGFGDFSTMKRDLNGNPFTSLKHSKSISDKNSKNKIGNHTTVRSIT